MSTGPNTTAIVQQMINSNPALGNEPPRPDHNFIKDMIAAPTPEPIHQPQPDIPGPPPVIEPAHDPALQARRAELDLTRSHITQDLFHLEIAHNAPGMSGTAMSLFNHATMGEPDVGNPFAAQNMRAIADAIGNTLLARSGHTHDPHVAPEGPIQVAQQLPNGEFHHIEVAMELPPEVV